MIIETFSTFRWVFATNTASIDASGYETWPYGQVRASGFTGLALSPGIATFAFPLQATVNGMVADGGGSDLFDWYLSQRTDDPAARLLSVVSSSPGYSGTIQIVPSALGAAQFPGTSSDSLMQLFRCAQLYCSRRSDKAIQWVDLYAYFFGVPGY